MTRKIDIIAIVSIISLLLISYTTLFHKERIKIAELKVKEERMKEKLGLAKEVDISIKTITEETNHIQKRLEESEKRLPRKEDIAIFLKDISKIAGYNNVKLMSIIPGNSEKGSFYSRIPINITVDAIFKELYKFLYQIENTTRVIRIEDITINEPNSSGICRTSILLSIFTAD
ncbi:MAG: type 4a pilus biogenesis protein PilO [Nitrospinae bacterium]|nr:type 4a pilus biogenesis protein PilO [Nitrospinota bacterium]